MRTLLIVALALFVGSWAHAAEKLPTRVLYCGDLAEARSGDFREFLEQHFAKVGTADAGKFRADQAREYDVVILDWSDIYDQQGLNHDRMRDERPPKIEASYARPTLLIGHMGGKVARPLKLKIDWLCLCMKGPAHRPALEHPIFHSPLEVDARLEEFPTPGGYEYRTFEKLAPTMQVFRIQDKEYPDVDPGLVSTLEGFDDSPDAEVFARGNSMKGPDTVSLGRHGNFLLWGYSAKPSYMTPAGQRLFVNAICYIQGFDGQAPLERVQNESRLAALHDTLTPRIIAYERDYRRSPEFREEFRRAMGNRLELILKQFNGDLDAFVKSQDAELDKLLLDYFKKRQPEHLYRDFGEDAEKYLTYYRENLEWLRPAGSGARDGFVVDEDCKVLGVSNRSVELLERCIALLESGEDTERAKRLLARYTGLPHESAKEWRAWLAANRGRLYFSDLYGFRFFVAPNSLAATHTSASVPSNNSVPSNK